MSGPLPRGRHDANSVIPYQWSDLWIRIKGPYIYMVTALGSSVKWPSHCLSYGYDNIPICKPIQVAYMACMLTLVKSI